MVTEVTVVWYFLSPYLTLTLTAELIPLAESHYALKVAHNKSPVTGGEVTVVAVAVVVQSYLDLSSVRSQLVPAQQLELWAFSHLTLGLPWV